MSTERPPPSDKELWRSLAAGRDVAPAALSDLDFAAWLEGRLSEMAAARIEAAVAGDPDMLVHSLDDGPIRAPLEGPLEVLEAHQLP